MDERMIEAESEAAHRATMLVIMLFMLAGCGIGVVATGIFAWLTRSSFCNGISLSAGW